MLKAFRHLLDTFLDIDPTHSAAEAEQALRLATAVLLVEVMRADQNHSATERQAVIRALSDRFALPLTDEIGLGAVAVFLAALKG